MAELELNVKYEFIVKRVVIQNENVPDFLKNYFKYFACVGSVFAYKRNLSSVGSSFCVDCFLFLQHFTQKLNLLLCYTHENHSVPILDLSGAVLISRQKTSVKILLHKSLQLFL